jgi:uncharacterized delta-60 repeat protein
MTGSMRSAAAAVLACAAACFGQSGMLDPSFGDTGQVRFGTPPWGFVHNCGYGTLNQVLVQGDGRIVAIGKDACGNAAVVRLHADGSIDTSFGQGGTATVQLRHFSSPIGAVDGALQSDGKIIIMSTGAALARLLPNGALDPTFGSGGIATVTIGGRSIESTALTLQPDGRILMAGSIRSTNLSATDSTVVRLLSNGSLDTRFANKKGYLVDTFELGSDTITRKSLALQSDGKIVVGIITTTQGYVARYRSDGAVDNTFGSSGRVLVSTGGSRANVRGVQVTTDQRIVVGGSIRETTDTLFVSRYLPNGTADLGFGAAGRCSLILPSTQSDAGYGGLLLHWDGRAMIAGSFDPDGAGPIKAWSGAWSVTGTGLVNVAFGPGGDGVSELWGFDERHESGRGIAVDHQGRIIVIGSGPWGPGENDRGPVIKRFLP